MATPRKTIGRPLAANTEDSSGARLWPGERELVVVARPNVRLRRTPEGVASAAGADVAGLAATLHEKGVTLMPLFGVSEQRLEREVAEAAATGLELPDMSVYYRVDAPDEQLEDLADCLCKHEEIEAAYVKPPAVPAMWQMDVPQVSDEAPPVTPNFVSRQAYLNGAPEGIDAHFAGTLPGGPGTNVQVIDIEGAWRFSHEDLLQNQGGVVGGTPSSDLGWRNHGTAVVGVIGGDRNDFGIMGICPDAKVMGVSIFGGMGSAAAIRHAADRLRPGDIILIELHRAGPRFNFSPRADQQGYIAIEWWPDDFQAIRYAVSRGIIVVEAAGNGAENLDDGIYDAAPPAPHGPFPSWWVNPFRRNPLDSGAILVGAGAPPPGTHGRNHGPDRSRLGFSNFGANVDAQGWGREVTTTGGRADSQGDLQGGPSEDAWYTDLFSGTSSASPIVVGAVGCLQGILRATGASPLTAGAARTLLRATGSPQQDAPGRPRTQRIGNRPDLRAMVARAVPRQATVPLYRYWNPRIGDHFYTTNWRELGNGQHGYRYEGVQAQVWQRRVPGTVPLYRYWNSRIGDHFYTTDWRELGNGRYGYLFEGVQCCVRPARTAETVALYRYWNPRIGDHFYTTDWRELGNGRYDYRLEGVAGYVAPARAAVPLTPPPPPPAAEILELMAGEPEPLAAFAPEPEAVEAVAEHALLTAAEPGPFELELAMPSGGEVDLPGAASHMEAKGGVGRFVDSFVTSLVEPDRLREGPEASFTLQPGGRIARDHDRASGQVAVTINVEGDRSRTLVP